MGNFTDLATSQVDRHSVIDPAILYFGIAARSRTGRNLVTTRECMMSFQRYFGLGEEARTSLLSTIDDRIAP